MEISAHSQGCDGYYAGSLFEILYMPEIPASAAINEAVELAKGYEDQKVVSFINGILGSFVRKELPDGGDRT